VVEELEQAFSSLANFLGQLKSRLLGPASNMSGGNEGVKEASSRQAAMPAAPSLPVVCTRGSSELSSSFSGSALMPGFLYPSDQQSGGWWDQELLHPMKLDMRSGVQETGSGIPQVPRAQERSSPKISVHFSKLAANDKLHVPEAGDYFPLLPTPVTLLYTLIRWAGNVLSSTGCCGR